MGLCYNCRELKEIVYVEDVTERGYCLDCAVDLSAESRVVMAFLELTVPFKVGDRVEAFVGGQVFDGVGRVEEVSMSMKNGGTPVHPMFRVKFDEKANDEVPDEAFYTECCLKKVE